MCCHPVPSTFPPQNGGNPGLVQQTLLYSPAPAVLFFLTVIYHSGNNSAPLLFRGNVCPHSQGNLGIPGKCSSQVAFIHSPLRKLHAAKLTMGMGWQHKVSSSCTVLIGATTNSSLFPLAHRKLFHPAKIQGSISHTTRNKCSQSCGCLKEN